MYLFTLATWMETDGVDPARFPKVAEHRRRMKADPVVSRVMAAEFAPS
jgi:glutathione S-transferase